ncbi:ABC transporter substrate-binding protein [Paracoccus aurantiacus]|uniref:ABC transporter substrate-binding protein n=1 Tax=Paracoccus aurantiacus TaxID=2599412 RepID=UPI0036428921
MTIKTKFALSGIAAALMMPAIPASAEILFWSTQAKPVEETQRMRDDVLSGFTDTVDYQASDEGPWITRIQAETQAGKGTIGVLGGLHGDFTSVEDTLTDIPVDLAAAKVIPGYIELGKLGGEGQKYVPWMQATYMMAANKQALEFLPDGADINELTYDQLIAWCKNIAEGSGGPKCGLPAGPKGLKHRFFQGYLLPSYTGGTVRTFKSAEAEEAWNKLKELWQYVNPASTNYGFMQEPLLTGEVWVAFDHTARLADAFNQKPDDFVGFPAPKGPKGRGYMPVIAGMAVPSTAPDAAEAATLIEYMLKPETQIATLKATNFFPVVDVELPDDLPPSVKVAGEVIAATSNSPDSITTLLPMGLGDAGGKFNQAYTDVFERTILGGQPVRQALDEQGAALAKIMEETGAPCWAPDASSDGAPCPVE